jgi:hypothetical protein
MCGWADCTANFKFEACGSGVGKNMATNKKYKSELASKECSETLLQKNAVKPTMKRSRLGVDIEPARLGSLSNRAREPARLGSFASSSWLV